MKVLISKVISPRKKTNIEIYFVAKNNQMLNLLVVLCFICNIERTTETKNIYIISVVLENEFSILLLIRVLYFVVFIFLNIKLEFKLRS